LLICICMFDAAVGGVADGQIVIPVSQEDGHGVLRDAGTPTDGGPEAVSQGIRCDGASCR
jgi:hypothetical protein